MPVINGGGLPTPTPTPAPTPTPITLTGTGGLFTRIGAMGGLLNAINLDRGTTIPPHFTSINNQFLSSNQDVISTLRSWRWCRPSPRVRPRMSIPPSPT